MNKNELVECFKKNICKYCTGNCDKGITFTQDGAKCVDYIRKEPSNKIRPSIIFWQKW